MQKEVFEILFERDDVTWQTMIHDLVKSEKMNPWDIDISHLAKKFLEMLNQL